MHQRFAVQELTTMALLAALLCVSSYISIMLPFSVVPITAQTLVINLIALLLKPKKTAFTVAIWILLGIVGLPVFSGGRGGFGVIAGPTGGFIIGYLIMVILISFVKGKENKTLRSMVSVIAVGIPVLYLIGIPWMKLATGLTWSAAFATGMLPFLFGDVVKCVLAVYIAKPLYRVVNAREYEVIR